MIALDTETDLFRPGNQIPKFVCVSFAKGPRSGVLKGDEARKYVFRAFDSGERLVFHSASFDLAVFCREWGEPMWHKVIDALEDGRIWDIELAEKMLDLYENGTAPTGKYPLAKMTDHYFEVELDKADDGWRKRYIELINVSIKDWPQRAYDYAEDDAVYTHNIAIEQYQRRDNLQVSDLFAPMAHECRASMALRHVSAEGMITDGEALDKLTTTITKKRDELKAELIEAGLLREDTAKKDQKALQALVLEHFGERKVPRTASGAVSYASDVINRVDHPAAKAYARYAAYEKEITFIEKLKKGRDTPIHPWINTMIATGRTSMGSSMQQLPRSGGIRECIVPRPGNEFANVDYSSAELRTWAECCYREFGYSKMRDLYVKDPDADPYIVTASAVLGRSVDDTMAGKRAKDPVVLQARQDAKVVVLGLPGGMGINTLLRTEHKKYYKTFGKQGSLMDKVKGETLKKAWKETFTEEKDWFRLANANAKAKQIKFHLGSGMYRGNIGYCDAANNPFQHLSGYGAKIALWRLFRACYYDPHPLNGCRPVHFVHDETLMEAPKGYGKEAADMLSEIMIEGMRVACPNVPITADPEVKQNWSKS